MPECIDFFSPEERDVTIDELNMKINKLNEELFAAKSDIKKILRNEYTILCDFCAYNGCCYTLNGHECRRRSKWKGIK